LSTPACALLAKAPSAIIGPKFDLYAMPDPDCKHKRTRLIAKDDDAQYVECLDCGEIIEAGERKEASGFDESLSDA
jgi:hypothetical protein